MHPYEELTTHEAMRAQFSELFAIMPDMRFETIRLEVRAGLFTHEWYLHATLRRPWQIGERIAQSVGNTIRARGVDVISCERGLIRRKDCYLDGVELELQLFGDR